LIHHNFGNSIKAQNQHPEIDNSIINLEHCTIAYNEGGIIIETSQLFVCNSILWNNVDEELFISPDAPSEIAVNNCAIKGDYLGNHNINLDPMFELNSFMPSKDSPCLGAALITDLNEDYNSDPRPLPANTNPDIGAFEMDYSLTSNSNPKQIKVSLYPNPAGENIYLNQVVDDIWLFNINGLMVYSGKKIDKFSISHLNEGQYVLMYSMGHKMSSEKISIIR